jgi:hypothetical protein
VNEGTPAEAPGGVQHRWIDGVTLGAYRGLRSGPSGVTELGRAFLEVHESDFLAAIGQLLLRVDALERRASNGRGEAS